MCRNFELLYIVCCFAVVVAQEIGGFEEGHTVDFIKDKVLADPVPGIKYMTDKLLSQTTDGNGGYDVIEEKVPAERGLHRIKGKSTAAMHDDDDAGRLAPVLGLEDTTMSGQTMRVTDPPTRDMSSDRARVLANPSSEQSSVAEMPPHIRKPDSQQRRVVMEQNRKGYRITCEADGQQEIVYHWLKDGQVLNVSNQYTKVFKNGTLVFTDFNDREEGLFQCLARNVYGTSMSVKVPIIFEKPPRPVNDNVNLTKSYEAIEGHPISMTCADTPPTVPEYSKRWYFLAGTTQLLQTDRIGTDNNGVLRFAYLEPNDATSYICALAPEMAAVSDSIRLYNSAVLHVQRRPKVPLGSKVAYVSTNVKAVVGTRAIMECFFSGYPIPSITWKHDNREITKADTRFSIIFGRRLIISDVREEDAGKYVCTANNGYGAALETVTLNVTGPPQKLANQVLDNMVMPEGKDVVLKCKARAIGQQLLDTPIWFRNGQHFNESSPEFSSRYVFKEGRTELHISNVNKALDTACFQCNISNSEGYLFYDAYLKVINSLVVTQQPPQHIPITNVSESVDITIRAKGDSCCNIQYKWHFNGSVLTESDLRKPPFVRGSNEELIFDPSSAKDESYETLLSRLGNYTCRVSDSYQHMAVSFMISMQAINISNPEGLTTAGVEGVQLTAGAEGVQLWWIGLLVGILLIVLAVIIVVVVKTNFPRNTYPLEKAEIKHHLNPEQDLLDQSFQEI